MSDFDDGMVIGLVIGKKKFKGGGEKYDSIFHDILENIVPILEHYDLGGGFTWTIGEWLSKQEYFGVYENGVSHSVSTVNTGEHSFGHLTIYCRELLIAGIVYKNKTPLYATIISLPSGDDNANDQYSTWGITTGENTYRSVAYKNRGDYKIDKIEDVTYTWFEPSINTTTTNGEKWITGFNLYYRTDLRYKYTHSWQEYTASGDNYSEPTVKKKESRTVWTSTGSLGYIYPFPRLHGCYTDLDSSSMYKYMDELAYAIIEKAGGKTEPVKIIQPTE